MDNKQTSWIAFAGSKRIASGAPKDVATAVKAFADTHAAEHILVFDAVTSLPVEIDLRGSPAAVLQRLPLPREPEPEPVAPPQKPSGRGRPKLGVVGREVTLLPRHWEWLAAQPGGASVALRKLVEKARSASKSVDQTRQSQEAAYRFMNAMAGNEPGYEEATRALFAGDFDRLRECVSKWPSDIRSHALSLAKATGAKQEDA